MWISRKMSTIQYSSLRRAQLSIQYLHTNSTTHEFLFGALAELVDNSRDAGASRIDVYTEDCSTVRGEKILCFLDNGEGMLPEESAKVIQFGYSGKRVRDMQSIGQYGNGLKSGAMRIGKDFILFSKRNNTQTCVFLSRSFHESEGIQEVVVPMPSWSQATKMPLGSSEEEQKKYRVEMDIITRFSPFKTVEDVLAQFETIGSHGTLVMIYNLQLGDSGQTELDFTTRSDDILMDSRDPLYSETEASMKPERRSFRAYTALLYFDPKMKIYIQRTKVRTKRLTDALYKPRMYRFTSKRFKTRMELEVKKARDEAKLAEMNAKEAESTARDAESKQNRSKEARIAARNAQTLASRASEEAKAKINRVETMEKSLKEPKTLDFIFGLNIDNRSQDGLFIYNCSRLIKMYERVGPMAEGTRAHAHDPAGKPGASGEMNGLVGLVNVPYMVLEPTHNKQDFADAKEYRHLLKAMADHLYQYWRDVELDGHPDKTHEMWKELGYMTPTSMQPADDEPKYRRRRNMKLLQWVQCDSCSKWREIPYRFDGPVNEQLPTNWTCSMNSSSDKKKCSDPEQKKTFPIGELKRVASNSSIAEKEPERRKRKADEASEAASGQPPAKRTVTAAAAAAAAPSRSQAAASTASASRLQAASATATASRSQPTATPEGAKRSATATATPARSQPTATAPAAAALTSTIVPQRKAAREASSKLHISQMKPEKKSERMTIVSSDSDDSDDQVRRRTDRRPSRDSTFVTRDDDDGDDDEPMIIKRRAPQKLSAPHSSQPKPSASKQSQPPSVVTTSQGAATSHASVSGSSRSTAEQAAGGTSAASLASINSAAEKYPMNSKVEARVNKEWYSGTVVKYSTAKEGGEIRIKVKFDQNRHDKYDKHFLVNSADLRLAAPASATSPAAASASSSKLNNGQLLPASGSGKNAAGGTAESGATMTAAASAATAAASTASQSATASGAGNAAAGSAESSGAAGGSVDTRHFADITDKLRTTLQYFLPPTWGMEKDDIGQLTPQQLSEFPLMAFFDQYEAYLNQIVESFKGEAANQKKASDTKLDGLRRNVARLLRNIEQNQGEDADDDTVPENVDQLLEAVVNSM